MRFKAKSCTFIERNNIVSLKFLGSTFSNSFRIVKDNKDESKEVNNNTNKYYINVGTESYNFYNAIEKVTVEDQQITFSLTSRVSEDLRMSEININLSKTGVSIAEVQSYLKDKIGI